MLPARARPRARGAGLRGSCACAGLTLVELIVVICIIALSATALLDRLRYYQEAAEKAAMEQTVGVLKSGLQLRMAALLLKGERDMSPLARANPFDWLTEAPSVYRGEFLAEEPAVPRGSWYFDAGRNQVVYVPNLDAHLRPGPDGSKRLRFRVELEFEPGKADSKSKQRVPAATRVAPVRPYVWF